MDIKTENIKKLTIDNLCNVESTINIELEQDGKIYEIVIPRVMFREPLLKLNETAKENSKKIDGKYFIDWFCDLIINLQGTCLASTDEKGCYYYKVKQSD